MGWFAPPEDAGHSPSMSDTRTADVHRPFLDPQNPFHERASDMVLILLGCAAIAWALSGFFPATLLAASFYLAAEALSTYRVIKVGGFDWLFFALCSLSVALVAAFFVIITI